MSALVQYEGTREVSLMTKEDENFKQLVKDMYFKNASDTEFNTFLHICKRTGLDPIARQIYAILRWDSGLNKNVMTVQVGIDGYRLVAERTGKYCPGREPTFSYGPNGELVSATAYVKKLMSDGIWHEIGATAFYAEYVQTNKDGKPTKFWQKMAHSQTAKCAESLALRKAFPSELSTIYTTEEMEQADIDSCSSKKMVGTKRSPFIERTIEVENAIPKLEQMYEEPQKPVFPDCTIEQLNDALSHLGLEVEINTLHKYVSYVAEKRKRTNQEQVNYVMSEKSNIEDFKEYLERALGKTKENSNDSQH